MSEVNNIIKTGNVNVPGPLHSTAVDGIVAYTGDVYDDNLEKTQRQINAEFKYAIDHQSGGGGSTVDVYNKAGELIQINSIYKDFWEAYGDTYWQITRLQQPDRYGINFVYDQVNKVFKLITKYTEHIFYAEEVKDIVANYHNPMTMPNRKDYYIKAPMAYPSVLTSSVAGGGIALMTETVQHTKGPILAYFNPMIDGVNDYNTKGTFIGFIDMANCPSSRSTYIDTHTLIYAIVLNMNGSKLVINANNLHLGTFYDLVINSLSSSTIQIRNSILYNKIVEDTTVYTIGSKTYNGIKEVIESKHTLIQG